MSSPIPVKACAARMPVKANSSSICWLAANKPTTLKGALGQLAVGILRHHDDAFAEPRLQSLGEVAAEHDAGIVRAR